MNATQLAPWILDIAQTHTEKFRKSVLGCNIWNSLPFLIRYSKSLTQFKRWQSFLRNNTLHLVEFVRFCCFFVCIFPLGLLHSIALLVTVVLIFTHAPLSAS